MILRLSALRRKPGALARLVGAPVVLASGVGRNEIGGYDNPTGKIKIEYLGDSPPGSFGNIVTVSYEGGEK